MNKEINNNGYDYVDLALPTRTLWATCNVGANKPSDSGLYFQWGDTKGYANEQVEQEKQFTWDDYKWNPSRDGYTFIKYAKPGAKLDLEDDAAHVNMGGDWHMPTPEQIKELIDNTTSSLTVQEGVNGRLFTSKKDGSKSIFIPAAGDAYGNSVYGSGDLGNVWSSMLSMDDANTGQYLYFYAGKTNLDDIGNYRSNGFSVRGVIDRSNDNSKGNKNNMEVITKDFLIKKGFKEEFKNIFTYSNKDYTINVIYSESPIHNMIWETINRHWKIIILHSTGYTIANILVQTKEQFKMAMEICDADLNNK